MGGAAARGPMKSSAVFNVTLYFPLRGIAVTDTLVDHGNRGTGNEDSTHGGSPVLYVKPDSVFQALPCDPCSAFGQTSFVRADGHKAARRRVQRHKDRLGTADVHHTGRQHGGAEDLSVI